jgi:hypothetical protein
MFLDATSSSHIIHNRFQNISTNIIISNMITEELRWFCKCCPNKTPSIITVSEYSNCARRWWLMPVILASPETEIRRIKVGSHPWANK